LGAWDDPVATMRRMSEEMDQIFERLMGRSARSARRGQSELPDVWAPQIEVSQQGDRLVISADLPGIRKEDVQVEIEDGRIMIQGERRSASERNEGGVLRSECSYGKFYRAIPLPEGADAGAARASMHDGVLEITLPMPQRRSARRLEIQEENLGARKEAEYQTAEQGTRGVQPHQRETRGTSEEEEQDRRSSERRNWQSEGRLGM
jgi:HSP20 family protein